LRLQHSPNKLMLSGKLGKAGHNGNH
jgi:hypothetical protein